MNSSTAVEQILGRIMRLPGASRKQRDELNKAYAFTASRNFAEAAGALADALVEYHGFNRQEARDLIVQPPAVQTQLPLDQLEGTWRTVAMRILEMPRVEGLPPDLAARVDYDASTQTLTFRGVMEARERTELERCFSTPEGRVAVEQLYRRASGLRPIVSKSPPERGERFAVPQLAIRQGDLFEVFEETHFLGRRWRLSECDPFLSESDFPNEVIEGQKGEITITERGRVEFHFLSTLRERMSLLDKDEGWTVSELVYWLDQKIPHPDITPTDSGVFLTRLVRALVEERGLNLTRLVRDKYRIRQAVSAKIERHRREANLASYQDLLLPDCDTPLVVTPEICFSFPPSDYPYNTRYDGAFTFRKHYYPQVGNLAPSGEEFECAEFIDSLSEVKFWVRNLERRPSHSFWLQTSTDKFYPDFVCLLRDGRFLVVEYKGENLWSNEDSKEKRDLGGLWEARSSGRCLFMMPRGKDLDAIRTKLGQRT